MNEYINLMKNMITYFLKNFYFNERKPFQINSTFNGALFINKKNTTKLEKIKFNIPKSIISPSVQSAFYLNQNLGLFRRTLRSSSYESSFTYFLS